MVGQLWSWSVNHSSLLQAVEAYWVKKENNTFIMNIWAGSLNLINELEIINELESGAQGPGTLP